MFNLFKKDEEDGFITVCTESGTMLSSKLLTEDDYIRAENFLADERCRRFKRYDSAEDDSILMNWRENDE